MRTFPRGYMQLSYMWGFPKLGVTYWGPYHKGMELSWGRSILNPHVATCQGPRCHRVFELIL